MATGTNLQKALEWFDRAVDQEAKGATTMMEKCIAKMIECEQKGLEAGESWD